MTGELDSLQDLSSQKNDLEKKCAAARSVALDLADQLSVQRRKVAVSLAKKMVIELKSLAMDGAKVTVEVNSGEADQLQEWGLDHVRFLLSANPGEQVKPLARVASGGELSRVLLALKVVLSAIDKVPAYVFDEVDSGVGGAVAEIIGKKLAKISSQHQVLCVTHLAQIAAHADSHYVVSKRAAGQRTISEITRLHRLFIITCVLMLLVLQQHN